MKKRECDSKHDYMIIIWISREIFEVCRSVGVALQKSLVSKFEAELNEELNRKEVDCLINFRKGLI